MKNKFFGLLFALFIIPFCGFSQVTFHAKGYLGDVVFARYVNGKAYSVDTLHGNESYLAKTDKLDKGIYLFLMGKKYVEIPLGENKSFSISVDFAAEELQKTMKISGSPENSMFLDFIKCESPEKMAAFSAEKSVSQKDGFLKLYMKALTPVIPIGANDTVKFYYSRLHFWDSVDLTQPLILNSPIVPGKLDYFFNKMMVQQPDTVIKHIKNLLAKPMADTVFHSVLGFLLEYTFESKIMGMEKSFVWLAENYFVNGNGSWLPEKTLATVSEQYQLNRFCLVGNKGYDLKLTDSKNQPFNLYQTSSNYTLLLFYDIGCGSCKKVVEEIHSRYSELFLKGVEVVALNTETDREKWLSYIQQHQIEDWHNVMDFDSSSNYHFLYGVQQTPTVYLLDKKKKILGKKLTIDQVLQIIETRKNQEK